MSNIKNMRFMANDLENAYKALFRTKFPVLIYPYYSFNPNYHGVVAENVAEFKKSFADIQSRSAVNTVVIDKIKR